MDPQSDLKTRSVILLLNVIFHILMEDVVASKLTCDPRRLLILGRVFKNYNVEGNSEELNGIQMLTCKLRVAGRACQSNQQCGC